MLSKLELGALANSNETVLSLDNYDVLKGGFYAD